MEPFVSLNNSSESLEKSISLIYSAFISNEDFYSDKEQYVFYGHNLPKITKNLNVSGTIGFYIDNFFDENWSPIHSYEELWELKEIVINNLVINGRLSYRTSEKLLNNKELYIKVISKLPVDFIFPQFYSNLLSVFIDKYPNVHLKKLALEENIEGIYTHLPSEKNFYSIYGLESDGRVGHYYMNLNVNNKKYIQRTVHLYRDLNKRLSLSGNVGILLAAIDYNMENEKYILGYRERKNHLRKSRNFALDQMTPAKKIIEPKNHYFNSFYDGLTSSNEEKMSNEVVQKVFKKVMKELNY